jgi:hypothetical protein
MKLSLFTSPFGFVARGGAGSDIGNPNFASAGGGAETTMTAGAAPLDSEASDLLQRTTVTKVKRIGYRADHFFCGL